MKNYNSLYMALFSMLICFSKAYGMEKSTFSIQPISEIKTISSLNNQIQNLDKSKHKLYKPIIDDITLKLRSHEKLTPNKINIIDYTLKIIRNEDVKDIIKDINQQKVKNRGL